MSAGYIAEVRVSGDAARLAEVIERIERAAERDMLRTIARSAKADAQIKARAAWAGPVATGRMRSQMTRLRVVELGGAVSITNRPTSWSQYPKYFWVQSVGRKIDIIGPIADVVTAAVTETADRVMREVLAP